MNREVFESQPYYYSNDPEIICEYGDGSPLTVVNVVTHGNEFQPLIAVEEFRRGFNGLCKGTIRFTISNPPALRQNQRFLITDLNRTYPGDIKGEGENRIAAQYLHYITDADYVIDLHTASNQCPPFIVLGKRDEQRLHLAEIAPISPIVLFEATKPCAMVDFTKCGIGIELGDHKNPRSASLGVDVIYQYLIELNLLEDKLGTYIPHRYFEVYKSLTIDEISPQQQDNIHNFEPISNSRLGIDPQDQNSFPILCGKKDYTSVYCYLTYEISRDNLKGGDDHVI